MNNNTRQINNIYYMESCSRIVQQYDLTYTTKPQVPMYPHLSSNEGTEYDWSYIIIWALPTPRLPHNYLAPEPKWASRRKRKPVATNTTNIQSVKIFSKYWNGLETRYTGPGRRAVAEGHPPKAPQGKENWGALRSVTNACLFICINKHA